MEQKKTNEAISIKIHEIRVVSFFMKEPDLDLQKSFNEDLLRFEYGVNFSWDIPSNKFNVLLDGALMYNNEGQNLILLKCDCITTYIIKNLASVLSIKDNTKFKMPTPLLAMLVGSAISHARGALSEKTSGSFIHNYPIPLVNTQDFLKYLTAGNLTEEQQKEKKTNK